LPDCTSPTLVNDIETFHGCKYFKKGQFMHSLHRWLTRLLCVAIAWSFAGNASQALIVSVGPSNVDTFFGSQSDAYQNSNPVAGSWSAIGPGPYAGPGLPAGVPAAPAGNVVPSNITPLAPTPSISSFNDGGGNLANSGIVAYVGGPNSLVDDAQIGMFMNLTQTGSSAYAYEQLNYAADYSLTNIVDAAGVLTGASPSNVSRSFAISGSVGSWVEFGGIMNFWDVPTAGAPTLLGSLLFSYYNASPGTFSTVVSSSSLIGSTPVTNPDLIRVTGDFFVAGDPSSISVQSVPEPSSLLLAALGIVGLLTVARRRR
jgi:PEP-CTERM motif-containing protein